MKKNQNARKEVIRDQYFKIRISKEEKELFYKYAEDVGINPSRLARNILLIEAESKLKNNLIYKPTLKAYRKYLEITKQFDTLKLLKED